MALMSWLRSKMSPKHRATWLLRRGILNARAGRTAAAMGDYSEVIKMEGVPPTTRAMALYNRGLLQSAEGNITAASEDLNQILEMPGASQEVMTEARRKLTRMSRSNDRMTSRTDDSTTPERTETRASNPPSSKSKS